MTLYSCIPKEHFFPQMRRGTIRSKTHPGGESDEKVLILLNFGLDIMGRGSELYAGQGQRCRDQENERDYRKK